MKDSEMRWSEGEKDTIVSLIEQGMMFLKIPEHKLYKAAYRKCCERFDRVMGKLVREKQKSSNA